MADFQYTTIDDDVILITPLTKEAQNRLHSGRDFTEKPREWLSNGGAFIHHEEALVVRYLLRRAGFSVEVK